MKMWQVDKYIQMLCDITELQAPLSDIKEEKKKKAFTLFKKLWLIQTAEEQ